MSIFLVRFNSVNRVNVSVFVSCFQVLNSVEEKIYFPVVTRAHTLANHDVRILATLRVGASGWVQVISLFCPNCWLCYSKRSCKIWFFIWAISEITFCDNFKDLFTPICVLPFYTRIDLKNWNRVGFNFDWICSYTKYPFWIIESYGLFECFGGNPSALVKYFASFWWFEFKKTSVFTSSGDLMLAMVK